MNVLQDCLLHLTSGSQPIRGGGVELLDQSERARLAYDSLKRYATDFKAMGTKFDPYRLRVETRTMLMQSQHNFHLIRLPQGDEIFVQSTEALKEALNAGFEYHREKYRSPEHWFKNPCGEIALDSWGTNNLQPETPVIRSGSPYPKHLNHVQHRLLIRAVYRWLQPCNKDSVIVECLPHIKISKTVLQKLRNLSKNIRVTEMVYAFYNETKKPNTWAEIRQMRENLRGDKNVRLFAEGVAEFIKDALGPMKPMPLDWRTSTVMSMLRTIRESEDFSTMSILADALQDAGCDDGDLLTHYRNPDAKISLASWIFRATGMI